MNKNSTSDTYLKFQTEQIANSLLEMCNAMLATQKKETEKYIQEEVDRRLKEMLESKSTSSYTRKEAAKKVGISLVTLDKFIKAGVIKASRIGKSIRISENDLNLALKEIKSLKYKY
jgi:excisionase family DNA binding protein